MFDKKDEDDVCYCESCHHKTARECLDLQCSCCKKADSIRFYHVVVPEDDLSYNEVQCRKEEANEQEEEKRIEDDKLRGWMGWT